MASSKVMTSPSSRSSDLSRKSSSGSSKPKPQPTSANSVSDQPITIEDFLRRASSTSGDSALIDTQITLLDASDAIEPIGVNYSSSSNTRKTVDEVWREIVSGESNNRRKECKEEASDGVMTLEDFLLARTGAGAAAEEEEDELDVKNLGLATQPLTEGLSGGMFTFEIESGEGRRGRGKRGRGVVEHLDKAAQQRQRRMIKNRESAARSRERKQAYQVELESLAVRLEEENEQLLKEKAERTKERLKQLMEKVIPVEEKRRPPCVLRRVRSFQW